MLQKSSYPLATSSWDEKEIAAIQEVIKSGIFTMGEKVAAFERDFSFLMNTKYSVMVNSGSSANLLMIAAMFFRKENPLRAGDEIIVPAVSWSTTYYPLQQYGLKLKFIDIDLDTLNFDLVALAAAVTQKTKAVLAVNLLGNPNDFKKIKEIIGTKDIVLLEDNCESMGAVYNGRMTGTFGLMGTFSSFFSHHIATMEGGVVVTDDEELYHILLALRAHGWTRNLPTKNKVCSDKSDNVFDEAFRFVLPGYNVRPVEMSGAIGIEQLKKLPGFVAERQKNAEYFKAAIGQYKFFRTQRECGSSSWFGFSIIIDPSAGFDREQVLKTIGAQGIEYRPIVAGNFTKNEVIKYFDYEIHGQLTNAEKLDAFGFFVGNHQYSIVREIDILMRALSTFQ